MASDKVYETITADDVAQMAGVSRWTVHRAFKKDASISAKSRGKVMEAAKTLGYVPDLLAVSLASDRSGLVALLVDDFSNPQQIININNLTTVLRDAGWQTIVINTRDEDDAYAGLLQASQHRVDAAVMVGARFDDARLADALGAQRVRRLIIFGRKSNNPSTVSVCCDDVQAMTEITDYVLSRGYTRPLFVAGPATVSVRLLRKGAFCDHWQAQTGNVPDVFVSDTFNPEDTQTLITRHFTDVPKAELPDVIVCETDSLAMGVMDGLRYGLGLRVPEDVAVTGFDDSTFARNGNYDLTTYQQPNDILSKAVVQTLQSGAEPSQFDRLSGQLVIRSSA
ncbi:LacI family DNA-binding transcriptional regulator [Tateyamaria sp. SN6-1]|uniref:LacI family DNA-binding transcriptional regulator n=1 Tax=Tateyamaria sp. SN6-1 TaxID=3092148 RepID=UPI0039F5096C